jgi:hypothetical protein
MKTVWIYINTDALPGDVDHLQVFATGEVANRSRRMIRRALPSNIRFRSKPNRTAAHANHRLR